MSQEVHGSNVPVPIHFKAEDGDFVFRMHSSWALTRQCKQSFQSAAGHKHYPSGTSKRDYKLPTVPREMRFNFSIGIYLVLVGAGGRELGERRESKRILRSCSQEARLTQQQVQKNVTSVLTTARGGSTE